MSFIPKDHLTKLICLWLDNRGVFSEVTKSVYNIAEIIHLRAVNNRIVVYSEGYGGQAYLRDFTQRVSCRVAVHNDDGYRWVHPHDPDFFSAIAEHLRLGSSSEAESSRRVACESSSL